LQNLLGCLAVGKSFFVPDAECPERAYVALAFREIAVVVVAFCRCEEVVGINEKLSYL
jgi:hypothetical protein